MDLARVLEAEELENSDVEFKHENEENTDIGKEIVAFANRGGGAVVIGVAESDDGLVVTGVSNPQKIEEEVSQTLSRYASPPIDPGIKRYHINSSQLLVFKVDGGPVVHSFGIDQPVFPYRQGSTTSYLDGHDIRYRYGEPPETQDSETEQRNEAESSLTELPSQHFWLDHGPHCILNPSGDIAQVCTFGEIYPPQNPIKMSARASKPDLDQVEHFLACLAETFKLQEVQSNFTINQSKAAWVGAGLSNFFESIRSQNSRYENAGLDSADLYKSEQALYVANLSYPYPESLLVVYAEPWVSEDFCRHFQIHLITDGHPTDTRPLNEFSDESGLSFGTAEAASIPGQTISGLKEISLNLAKEARTDGSGLGAEGSEIAGYLIENPFAGETETLTRLFDSEVAASMSSYSKLFGHFLSLPPEDAASVYPDQMSVFDYGAFAPLPLEAVHVDLQLNWSRS